MLTAIGLTSRADEGMWLPSLIASRIQSMQEKGFKLDAEDIYSINQASLKDAVVLFGGGCTGEIISDRGLLLTNHHCGYRQIQAHSSVEHDYLRDGFWAMDPSEELPNKGLTVKFLERMEDVTSIILKDCEESMDNEATARTIRANSKKLIEEATADGNGLKATVEALYYGNQYYLFVYREYSDIRLVGAPPSSIGKFGGDTDNWMWPRHTGDFSIFRIYADKDNNPSPYSPDNVPYKPKKFFRISTSGVQEGDFTFIYGFPGSTQEYIHSEAVRYVAEVSDPLKIHLRTIRLGILKKYMDSSQKVRIQYSSKYASISNAWKKWQGEELGLRRNKIVAKKAAYEREFSKWAAGNSYSGLCDSLSNLCKALEPYKLAGEIYNETVRTIELASYASRIEKCFGNDGFDRKEAEDIAATFFKDYCPAIDKECFIAMMEEFGKCIPEEFIPHYYLEMVQKYGSVEAWADFVFETSLFLNEDLIASIEGKADVESDIILNFYNAFREWYNRDIRPEIERLNAEIFALNKEYMRGQMEYSEAIGDGRAFYPDANLTLRVAYGQVKGYSPADGIYYKASSTIKGIMQKDDPNVFDYNIPQSLRDIYASKDYGIWAGKEDEIPVCFLADNHTTGGNSGSPVINCNGDLIGINFDRVWEGTMSDIAFDPDRCRNISLDVRYLLFIIDKIGNADWLFDEMVFTGDISSLPGSASSRVD